MLKNGFVKKNVGTLTLGERLSKVRSEKRITLGEVSKGTRIQVKYLEYLENGDYDQLPADVYVKGFLRNYAQYLGLDENYLMRLYERERDIHKNIKKEDPQKKIFQPVKFSSWVFTPKIAVAVLIFFFIGLGFFYLYRELSIFISSPRLVVTSPLNNFVTQEQTIKIEGTTEKDAKLFINDQQAIVNEDGKFFEDLALQPGLNTITVKAVNRFDKSSEKVLIGKAEIQISSESQQESSSSGDQSQPGTEENQSADSEIKIKAEVYGDTKATSIVIKTDGTEVFRGMVSPGEVKNFEAKSNISVSADKGKYVGVRINGKDLGTLSKDTKPVTNRIFTAE